jgi:ribonucleoside-diphosphate reductase alpha chain
VTHKFGLSGHEGYITVGLYPNGQPGEIFIRMAKEGSTVSGLMDSFATAVSLALQHGVPLKVLCEKFAHTRFEPSGWTGNEQIGYAKSIMDYLFRWIELRFLQGTQLDLFAGLAAPASVPVQGTVTAPSNTVVPHSTPSSGSSASSLSFRSAAEESAVASTPHSLLGDDYDDRTAPQGGIAPDLQARSGLSSPMSFEDRGIYHTAEALRNVVNMGDAPSCATCGAIMTRNGSCYRCGECGSTSGCS